VCDLFIYVIDGLFKHTLICRYFLGCTPFCVVVVVVPVLLFACWLLVVGVFFLFSER
jgi:hypothetical protein